MQETADSVDYPVRLEADYPESPSRWRALLGALFLIKGLLLLPHSIVLFFLGIASFIVFYIGYWAVLITGRYPRGMFNFVLGVQRWSYRTSAWLIGLTDRYPPFSLGVVEDYALQVRGRLSGIVVEVAGASRSPAPHQGAPADPPLGHRVLPGSRRVRRLLHSVLGGALYRPLSQGHVRLRGRGHAMGRQERLVAHRFDGPLSALRPEIGSPRAGGRNPSQGLAYLSADQTVR